MFQINPVSDKLATLSPGTLVATKKKGISEKIRATKAAKPTKMPHRVTLIVPSWDQTVFNLGKGCVGYVVGLDEPITHIRDTGITGRTKSHVHFETTGAPYTILSLGQKASDAMLTCTFTDGLSVPAQSQGYAMFTLGSAYSISEGQFYVLSMKEDVQIRSAEKHVVVQAPQKSVGISAGENVAISAQKGSVSIGASDGLVPEDKRFLSPLTMAIGSDTAVLAGKAFAKSFDILRAAVSLSQAIGPASWRAEFGTTGFMKEGAWDYAKTAVDAVKALSTCTRAFEHTWDDAGKVSVTADVAAGMTGGVAASVYGGLSASVTSLLSASLLGLLSASVKGIAWTSIWSGLGTSIKSMKDAGIEGQLGKCKVKGKTKVEVSSWAGQVTVTGKESAQLSSDGWVAAHGTKSGFFGTSQFGLHATEDELRLAHVNSAEDLGKPKLVRQRGLFINNESLCLQFGKDATLCLEADGVYLNCGQGTGVKVGENDLKVSSQGRIFVG